MLDQYGLKKLGLAALVLAAGISAASAQSITLRIGPTPKFSVWTPGLHPYARRHHDNCQRKAWRLREYERHAARDGRLSWRERREMAALQRDLDRTCSRWRWRD